MTEYENDRTFAPPEHLAGLIAEYGTPLWVLDPGGLRRRYRELKDFEKAYFYACRARK